MAENVVTKNDAFFAELLSPTAAKWAAGVAFDRSNGLPLDQWSVFPSEESATLYLTNPKAYPGQFIAYADDLGSMVACVISQNVDGSALELKKIGSNSINENETIEICGGKAPQEDDFL